MFTVQIMKMKLSSFFLQYPVDMLNL